MLQVQGPEGALTAHSHFGADYQVVRDDGVWYRGEGDLEFGSFLESFGHLFNGKRELDWSPFGAAGMPAFVRSAVRTWMLVARRLRVPRGVDVMIARMVCRRSCWTFKLYTRGSNISVFPVGLAEWVNLVRRCVRSCRVC
jgi:hypothetical protein